MNDFVASQTKDSQTEAQQLKSTLQAMAEENETLKGQSEQAKIATSDLKTKLAKTEELVRPSLLSPKSSDPHPFFSPFLPFSLFFFLTHRLG